VRSSKAALGISKSLGLANPLAPIFFFFFFKKKRGEKVERKKNKTRIESKKKKKANKHKINQSSSIEENEIPMGPRSGSSK
jgi:hypothetical protein